MHTEIARLWQSEELERTERALSDAIRLSQASGQVDPRLVNNLGALHHLQGRLDQARAMYETALTSASGLESGTGESMATSILYNLARVYEDQGEESMARTAYDKLLARHPEYVDGTALILRRQIRFRSDFVHPQPRFDRLGCRWTSISPTRPTIYSSKL